MLNRIRRRPALLALSAFVALAAIAFGWWTISPLFIRTTLVEGRNIAIATSTPAPMAAGIMPAPTATPEPMMADATATPEAMMGETMDAATATPEPLMAEATATTEPMMPAPTATTEAMIGEMMAEATATPEPMMSGPQVLAVGDFDHKDNIHYADGQAILLRQEDGSYAVRLQDLAAANGPDLFVYVTTHPDPMSGADVQQGGYNLGALKATNGSFSYALDPSIDPATIKTVTIYCRAFSVVFSVAHLMSGG